MYNLELRPNRRHFRNTGSVLERELDKFFDTFSSKSEDTFYAPACEITDEEKQYSISLDIPGIHKDDITIEVKDDQLYISGERKWEKKSERENVLRNEKRFGKFSRVFTLPKNINAEMIEARFENGVLDIVLPKEDKAQSRKISISGESGLKN